MFAGPEACNITYEREGELTLFTAIWVSLLPHFQGPGHGRVSRTAEKSTTHIGLGGHARDVLVHTGHDTSVDPYASDPESPAGECTAGGIFRCPSHGATQDDREGAASDGIRRS